MHAVSYTSVGSSSSIFKNGRLARIHYAPNYFDLLLKYEQGKQEGLAVFGLHVCLPGCSVTLYDLCSPL